MSIKPLGSEKLQGMDKISRILEIARYKETVPNNLNENSSVEYKLTLADGNEYQIVKEKVGYIIKKTISESSTDYLEPIKNRKYYPSYSQALKRLNLMAKEMNVLHENNEGTSLFSEQKKFVLKTPEKKNPEPSTDVENVPPPPAPEGAMPPPPPAAGGDDMGGEMPPPPPPPAGGEDMGGEDMGGEMPTPEGGEDMGGEMPAPEGGEDMGAPEEHEGGVTFKTIQKLTGKLGQKLRQLSSDEENKMSSKDVKYVINSILSALDLDSLDDEDKEEILSKFDGEEDMGGDEMGSEEDMGGDEMGGEESPEEMPSGEEMPEGEMREEARFSDVVSAGLTNGMAQEMLNHSLGSSTNEAEIDEDDMIESFAEGIFTEQKVENILTKYFVVSENEKKFNKQLQEKRKVVRNQMNSNVLKHVNRLSETVEQETAARKFLKGKSKVKFLGRTNKSNLVFEIENKQYKISPNGKLI